MSALPPELDVASGTFAMDKVFDQSSKDRGRSFNFPFPSLPTGPTEFPARIQRAGVDGSVTVAQFRLGGAVAHATQRTHLHSRRSRAVPVGWIERPSITVMLPLILTASALDSNWVIKNYGGLSAPFPGAI